MARGDSMKRWISAGTLVLVCVCAAGCGGSDEPSAQKAPESSGSRTVSAEDACAQAGTLKPDSTAASSDVAKSGEAIRELADSFPKGTIEGTALAGLADAYKHQADASPGEQMTKARSAVQSAWDTLSSICGDSGLASTVAPVPTPKVDPLAGKFPKGYPKKVRVSDVPFPINSQYEGMKFAVQLAPGVYTALPPGASVRGAAMGDIADGYCASIEAYSRKFRDGKEFGGSCW
jgi:hypothetical protein